MRVKVRDLVNGAAALKKLADNAALPQVLFLTVANAWRDVYEQLEIYQRAVQALETGNVHNVERTDPQTGGRVQVVEFVDLAARSRYFDGLDALHNAEVELPHVTAAVDYGVISGANTGLTPAEVASLFWLISVGEH